MKSAIKKVIMLTLSVVICYTILEIVIRKRFPHYDPRRQIVFHILDDYNGAAIGPAGETIRQRTPKGDYDLLIPFNRHGFRDNQDLTESTATDFFAVGDSFTMGWGVQENERFSNLVAENTDLRIFNIGIPGDFLQYIGLVHYARDRGAVISNMLVGVCMNNDLKNYNTPDKFQPMIYGDRSRWKARLRAELQSRSAVYLACSYELQQIPALRRMFEKAGIARDINELTLQNIYDQDVLISSADMCRQLAELVNPNQAWFVIIPSLALWIGDHRESEARIQTEFIDLLKERGLRVLDLTPAFEATGRPRDFYFETDAHWNAAGHAMAAEQISAWLK
ncbi:MAG TPA: SGNH/GDSL hydrolase family protein [Kiritimatiellia bacterium]|nr:SGNH/GDSL hydrolase family protein [Kiritimatiellia bacterium]